MAHGFGRELSRTECACYVLREDVSDADASLAAGREAPQSAVVSGIGA